MPTSKKVTDLKINKLTEAQYKAAVQAGVIDEDQLSLITDETEGQVKTFPVASADYEGQILQYVGVTDSTYTNGYFYKCTAQGTSPETYAWVQTDTQPSSGGGNYLPITGGTLEGELAMGSDPITAQRYAINFGGGNYLKSDPFSTYTLMLSYDGTTGTIKFDGGSGSIYPSVDASGYHTLGKSYLRWTNVYTTKISSSSNDITVPDVAGKMAVQVSLLPTAASTNEGEIYQFVGTTDSSYTNGHFYKCVSDGADPATYSWEEVQLGSGGGSSYTAGTGINITNGSISVAAPTVVNAASNNVQLNICPAGGTPNTTDRGGKSIVIGSNIKGGSLNDSGSIRIGNNINTDGAEYGGHGIYIASNGIDKTGGSLIVNASVEATTNNSGRTGGILIGGGYKPVIIGSKSGVANGGAYSIAIGGCSDDNAQLNSDYSVLLNTGNNSAANITEHNTFWWGNNNGMYKLFDADGTIPAARHAALPSADGTYVLKLVIANGVPTLSWVAE